MDNPFAPKGDTLPFSDEFWSLRVAQPEEHRRIDRIDREVRRSHRARTGPIIPGIRTRLNSDAERVGLRLENPPEVSSRPRDRKRAATSGERDVRRITGSS